MPNLLAFRTALTPSISVVLRMNPRILRLVVITLCMLSGCRNTAPIVRLPIQHSVQTDQLLVMSDVKLASDHPLITDLQSLRTRVTQTLRLPQEGRMVTVYLFSNEHDYQRYVAQRFPALPPRRAYFVGSSHELAVYTFWGQRVREDLRHEFTHGLLHAHLAYVPLWLDEGLAEYFEVAGTNASGLQQDYSIQLASAASNGWQPNLARLEQLEQVWQMTRDDYQESWAWVHYCMHGSSEARNTLLGYVQELRTNPNPGKFQDRLRQANPHVDAHFFSYVSALNTPTANASY